jgi:hypothetical protein
VDAISPIVSTEAIQTPEPSSAPPRIPLSNFRVRQPLGIVTTIADGILSIEFRGCDTWIIRFAEEGGQGESGLQLPFRVTVLTIDWRPSGASPQSDEFVPGMIEIEIFYPSRDTDE